MPYHIAGIDVHKKMLTVAVADVAVESDYHFERLNVGTSPVQLRVLPDHLCGRVRADGTAGAGSLPTFLV